MRFGMAVAVLVACAPAAAQDAEQRRDRNQPLAPFRVSGNIYHVGTAGLAAYLIVDPRGAVLIDGGLPESAPLIAANIARLGFRMRDVRYLLINHAHADHAGGLAALKRQTGARLIASNGDAGSLAAGHELGRADSVPFPAVRVDQVVRDGEQVRLGGITLTAHATPGHTDGCTSWSMPVTVAGRRLETLFACSLTVGGRALIENGRPTRAVAQFRATYAALRRQRTDVFLTFHPQFFALDEKRAALTAGKADAFVDPAELPRRLVTAEANFAAELARQTAAPQS